MCKLAAIKEFLGTEEIKVSSYNESLFEVVGGSEEYLVLTEEEADKEALESTLNLLDDIGIEGLSKPYKDYIYYNFVKDDKILFDEIIRNDYDNYIQDIKYEEGRLEEEMERAGVETEEEFLEYLIDQAGDFQEWYMDNFGEESWVKFITHYNLIDLEEVARDIIDTDGRGNILAGYDGNEEEQGKYYIYRIN